MGLLSGSQTEPILLQGSIAFGGGLKRKGSIRVKPVAASIVGNQLQLSFASRRRGRHGKQRLYQISAAISEENTLKAQVKMLPHTAGRMGTCASSSEDVTGSRGHEAQIGDDPSNSGGFQPSTLTRIITISTDADPDWYAKYGTESFARIAHIINAAEALYFQPLGIAFSIHKQHVYENESPYTSHDAGTLLNQFVMNSANSKNLGISPELYETAVDGKHLFTGKDLDGTVVGIAYVRSMCEYSSLAFGVTQGSLDLTAPAIFAHEVGHNLGAFHDLKNPGTLMYPSIVAGATLQFSEVSRGEIEDHLARSPACLEQKMLEPTPAPSPTATPDQSSPGDSTGDDSVDDSDGLLSLRIRLLDRRSARRTLVVRGQLIDSAGSAVAGLFVEMLRNGEPGQSKVTDTRGRVTFVVPRRHTREILLRSKDGRAVSRTLGFARELR
jgi:hypothetical protein